ncbi:MAG: 2-oxo acid dehydrogenase subunit E2 [Deltaproteobacteria bacterium]|nr:2-oxo acid dehydrogenase subunit E2 [Deltaproteobacteria bacterium]
MISEVRMPRLDEDMTEGTINSWLKNEGDFVNTGEPLVEIETQKVNYQIEAPGSGILRLILAHREEVVPINAIIAVIADHDEDISFYRASVPKKDESAIPAPTASESKGAETSEVRGDETRRIVSPVARKLASDMGVDLSKIQGTGPGGRITKDDVLNFKSRKEDLVAPATERRIRQTLPFSGVRKTIATRLSESWRNSPRAQNYMSVDVTELSRIREKNKAVWKEKHGVSPSVNDVIIAAAAIALREHPIVNSALQEGKIEVYEDINISIAVAYEKGLITPVVRKADARDIFNIARESRRLADTVRKSEHTSQMLAGSTFTITNLGMYDVEFFVPIINPPESAILAVGKVERKPVVINEAIAIRSMMRLCLAYDHRVLDGVVAAHFLASVKAVLENPKMVIPEEN